VNRRHTVVALLAMGVASRPLAALAQQQTKVRRIGVLISETPSVEAIRVEALRAGLRDHGYVEGRNIAIELRSADGVYARLPDLAAELAGLEVDVLVAFGIKALAASAAATKTIPIVIPATSSDPVAMGLVASMSRPGGNITGATAFGPQVMAKRLELLKEMVPRISRVAVLVNPSNPSFGPTFQQMEVTAKSLKLSLQRFEVRAPDKFADVLTAMTKKRFDAIVVHGDTMFRGNNAKAIAALAARQSLPAAGGPDFAEAGGVLSYGGTSAQQYRRAAYFVDRILRGTRAGDLPLEQPTRFELVINLKAAKALDITVPQSILLRADRVIE
jgi:putative tryptophan/tyrosine transport system substrate-binding protein